MPGRPRSILLGLEVRPAGKACNCKHNSKHRIAKGELRFIVKNPGPASGEHGYCTECAVVMLEAARALLDNHQFSLTGDNPPAAD